MAKRKVQPSGEGNDDFSATNQNSTARKRARPHPTRNATPSSSANPLDGRHISDNPSRHQADRDAADNRATVSGSDDDEDLDEEQRPVDLEALEETFRPQIEAERIANASRRGTPGESGVIESVEMHQFMCHKRLSFKFGNQVNFIIGHNGSGKSAVLTALTVALGGKALATGRGSGMKSFIREGQSAAEVTVVIKNEGDAAHRPDVFGRKISITRHFTEKSSTYKICSENGTVVGTKKMDVQTICDDLEIQVDNPLSILTQDAARKFLSATKPSEKYALFLRGTQLSALRDDYNLITENVRLMDKTLQHKQGDLPALKERLNSATQAFAESQKVRDFQVKLELLKTELAWTLVTLKEKELQHSYEQVSLPERRIEKIKEKLNDENAKLDATIMEVKELERQHEEAKKKVQNIWKRREEIQKLVTDQSKHLRDLTNDEGRMNGAMRDYTAELGRIEEDIAREAKKLEVDARAKREDLRNRMDGVKQRITELEDGLQSAGSTRHRLNTEIASVDRECNAASEQQQDSLRRIREVEEAIKMAQTGNKDSYAAFGNNVRKVLSEIQRQTWFGRIPIGPLGLYVDLDDFPTWGELMRTYIGSQMRAFAIQDARDFKKLKDILNRNGNPQNGIIIAGCDMFDYSGGEPPAQYLTPLRVLRIKDEWVKRILVNSSAIERTYLTVNRRDAEKLLDVQLDGVVMTSEGFKVTRWKADGGRKTEPFQNLHPKDPRRALFQSRDESSRIDQLRADLRQRQDASMEVSLKLQECQRRKADLSRQLSECQASGRGIDAQLRSQRSKLRELEEEAQEGAPVAMTVLEELRTEKEQAIENLVQQFKHLQEKKVDLQSELKPLRTQVNNMKVEAEAEDNERKVIADKVENVVDSLSKIRNGRKHFTTKLQEEQERLGQAKASAEAIRVEFERLTEVAEGTGERVPATRSVKDVEGELTALKKVVESSQRRNPKSHAELGEDVRNADSAYKKVKGDLRALKALRKALYSALVRRLEAWPKYLAFCAVSCKLHFQHNLSNRGYFGQVMMDHDKETLTLKVRTDDEISSQGKDKDPSSLSGGEKSFSTISLLLAMWQTCGSPLRCLDEFDVFMDAVNRRISMKMMIDTALASGKQYILITPQDMTNIQPGPGVKVLRMADPERGQTVLNF